MTLTSYRGNTPELGRSVWVDDSARIIGNVSIGDHSSVWPMTVIRGDIHQITIGRHCSVQDGSVLHVTHAGDYNPGGYPLIIGDRVTIGHQATLHGCTIGNRVLIGMTAVVMDGAVVEDEVVIGAGSLVTPGKVLESGHLYMGRPARKVRALSRKEKDYFVYTSDYYTEIAGHYIAEDSSPKSE